MSLTLHILDQNQGLHIVLCLRLVALHHRDIKLQKKEDSKYGQVLRGHCWLKLSGRGRRRGDSRLEIEWVLGCRVDEAKISKF